MTKGFTAESVIDAPPDRVFVQASDPARMHRWMPGVTSVRPADSAPMAVGKRFHVVLETRGRGTEREMTLTQWDPLQRFALSSKEGSVTAEYVYNFTPDGDRTRVSLDASCTSSGIVMTLLRPLIVRLMARHDRPQMVLLKQMVEA